MKNNLFDKNIGTKQVFDIKFHRNHKNLSLLMIFIVFHITLIKLFEYYPEMILNDK